MKLFIAEHMSTWAGMLFLALYLMNGSALYAVGFIILFVISTATALYKHAQFVVFTQKQREDFEQECREKHAQQMADK